MAFFDNTKRLLDAIPDVLLVKDVLRAPLALKNYQWTPAPEALIGALEAREAPETKVGILRPAASTPAAAKSALAKKGTAARKGTNLAKKPDLERKSGRKTAKAPAKTRARAPRKGSR